MRIATALGLAWLCTSCIVLRGASVDPHAAYDEFGRLALCSRGALRVEREAGSGNFETWCDASWGVIEALALPGGGFVVAARKHAHAAGGAWGERSSELWRVRAPRANPERLTENQAHEFDLALSSDGRSVVFRREELDAGGGLLRTPVAWGFVALDVDAPPPALYEFGPAEEFLFASSPYTSTFGIGRAVRDPTCSWANPLPVSVRRGLSGEASRAELIDAQPQRDGWLVYPGDNYTSATWVEWVDAAGVLEARLPLCEPVAARLSPAGARAVLVERRDWVFPYLVLVVFTRESATAREYDSSGRLTREIEL